MAMDEKKLADALAKRIAELETSGAGESALDLTGLSNSDKDEAVLRVSTFIYKKIRDGFTTLMANHGLTDDEAIRNKFLSENDQSYTPSRLVPDALGELKKEFEDLVETSAADATKAIGTKVDVRDVMSRIQFPQIMRQVIQLPMMRPLEPVYVLQSLFRRMSIPGMFGKVAEFDFPVIGALEAHPMGEDAEVAEKTLDLAGGHMTAKFAKIGVGVKYSDDFAKFANFDWLGEVLGACRTALAREKEYRAYRHIADHGSTIISNEGRFGFSGSVVSGTVSTAGTGIDGLRNGTHVLQDMFYMLSDFNDDGMMPDTVVLSPRAWMIWAQSPEMRAWAWQNGMPQLWQMPQGKKGRASEYDIAGGVFGANTDYPRGSSQYTTPPDLGIPQMRVVVSPFVTSGTDGSIEYTHAHVLDTATGIGYIIQNEEVMMSKWNDPEHDLDKIRFTERYAYGVIQDSLTIRHMKYLKTREIGVDARDRLWFSVNWAGGVGGPHIGNVA